MRFRNTKTGAIVDAPSMLRGNWERIDGGKSDKKETPAVVSEPTLKIETEAKPRAKKENVKSATKTRTRKTKK